MSKHDYGQPIYEPIYESVTPNATTVAITGATITGASFSSASTWVAATCVLCDAESHVEDVSRWGTVVFCDLCKRALLQARKNYVAESVEILLYGERKDEKVKFHQGFTQSGKLTHAVRLIKKGEYQPRAICGVRIMEAKARKFDSAERGTACSRCLGSLGTA
jgi:hypothetical protein